jgi:hypothetical protein
MSDDDFAKAYARANSPDYPNPASHTEVDHTQCPPGSHTFDAGSADYEGRVDEFGNLRCNDDGQPMFHCTQTEWYHHVGADAEPCLVNTDHGWAIPAPKAGEHVYQMSDHDRTVWTCILHGDGSTCPPHNLGVLAIATECAPEA